MVCVTSLPIFILELCLHSKRCRNIKYNESALNLVYRCTVYMVIDVDILLIVLMRLECVPPPNLRLFSGILRNHNKHLLSSSKAQLKVKVKVKLSICIAHRRVRRTPLMRFSSLTRAVDRTAAACSLQTQAGAAAGQAAQSAVQRSPPSVTHIMGYYSFNRPRRDGKLSWPCWLTDSGRRTHKVVKQPSVSLVQDKESPPARADVLTTILRHQLCQNIKNSTALKQS